jgi:hypothetical protein
LTDNAKTADAELSEPIEWPHYGIRLRLLVEQRSDLGRLADPFPAKHSDLEEAGFTVTAEAARVLNELQQGHEREISALRIKLADAAGHFSMVCRDLADVKVRLTDTAGHVRRFEEELKTVRAGYETVVQAQQAELEKAKTNRDAWQAKAERFGGLVESERKAKVRHQESVRAYERIADGILEWAKVSGHCEARDKFLELMNTVGLIDQQSTPAPAEKNGERPCTHGLFTCAPCSWLYGFPSKTFSVPPADRCLRIDMSLMPTSEAPSPADGSLIQDKGPISEAKGPDAGAGAKYLRELAEYFDEMAKQERRNPGRKSFPVVEAYEHAAEMARTSVDELLRDADSATGEAKTAERTVRVVQSVRPEHPGIEDDAPQPEQKAAFAVGQMARVRGSKDAPRKLAEVMHVSGRARFEASRVLWNWEQLEPTDPAPPAEVPLTRSELVAALRKLSHWKDATSATTLFKHLVDELEKRKEV